MDLWIRVWLGTLAVLGLPTLVFGVILWLLMRGVVAAEFLASVK